MSINSTISIAQTGLQANQYALTVVSNNIANVNTEGFCKQRVEFSEIGNFNRIPTAHGLQYTGAGVQIEDLKSYRNDYLDDCYRKNNANSEADALLANYAGYIESFFDSELEGNGLSGAINNFYDAAQKLSSNPSDMTMRTYYMEQANSLANTFNSVSKALNSYVKNITGDVNEPGSITNSQVGLTVSKINNLLERIADLNGSISQNSEASALSGSRATLMDELSSLISYDTTYNENGTANISIAGQTVVKASEQVCKLACAEGTEDEPCVLSLVDMDGKTVKGSSNINKSVTSGQLGAYLQLCNGTDSSNFSIKKVSAKLDTLASEFADAINEVQTYNDGSVAAMAMTNNKTLTPVGEDDVIFMNKNGGKDNITAANICINSDLLDNPRKVAAARVPINPDGTPVDEHAIGDNKNILAVIATRDEGIPGLNNMSPADYFKNLVSQIGSEVATLNSNADISKALTDSINAQRDAEMGVNVDEELINLIKYQRAYEASARVLSVANSVYDTLLSIV